MELGRIAGDSLFQREPALEQARLRARPGAEPRATGPGREVGISVIGRNTSDGAPHPHLPAQALPMEAERGLTRGDQLAALGAFQVRVEDKAAVGTPLDIEALQEDHAHIGEAAHVNRRERHCVGVVSLVRLGLLEPRLEQRERLRRGGEVGGLGAGVVFRVAFFCHRFSLALRTRPGQPLKRF